MNGLALCAGVAGLELGLSLVLPHYRAVVYVEREAFAAARLVARMEEGVLDVAPVWDDVATFDGRPWRGVVDCVTAGFPCQPWSAAGKGGGVDDDRWIWPDIRDRIREVEPRFVFLENVPPLVSRGGLAFVLGDLADLGFNAEWDLFAAADVGAPHRRERLFILAHRDECGRAQLGAAHHAERCDAFGNHADRCGEELADSISAGLPFTERRGEPRAPNRRARDRRRAIAELRRAPVGDAEIRRLRVLRESSRREGWRLVDRSNADVADASSRLFSESQRRTDRREGARSAGARFMANPSRDSLRLKSERNQREGRGARATERKHAVTGANVPLFPPAPGDVAGWRRIVVDRPDLAPALSVEDAAWIREHRSSGTHRRRWRRVSQARHAARGAQCEVERELHGMVDGLADRVDRLRACGNGVVPLAAAYAFLVLAARLEIWPALAVES